LLLFLKKLTGTQLLADIGLFFLFAVLWYNGAIYTSTKMELIPAKMPEIIEF